MKEEASGKTGLFLIELIVMVMLFALSAAVCMRIFGSAQVTADYSKNLSRASLEAQSAAECYKISGGIEGMAEILGAKEDGSLAYIYYDESWNETDGPNGKFTLSVKEIGENKAYINVVDEEKDEELFSLTVKAVAYGD